MAQQRKRIHRIQPTRIQRQRSNTDWTWQPLQGSNAVQRKEQRKRTTTMAKYNNEQRQRKRNMLQMWSTGPLCKGLQSGSLQRHRHGWRHRPVQPTTVILPTTMDRTRTVALRGTMVPRSPTVAIWPATASGIQPGTTATTDAYSTSAGSFHSRVWNNYNCLSHNHRPQHLQDSRAHDRQWRSSTCLSTNLWYRLSTDASYRGTNTTTSLSYRWASLGSWLQMGALQEHTRTTLGDAILRHRWHTTPHRQCYKTPGTRFRTQPQRYRVYTTERRCVSGTTYK